MTDALRDDSILQANDREVAAKVVDGEAVLINLSNGLYYSMDKVGGVVWSMIAGGTSITRIADSVAKHYTRPADQVQTDVRQLVEQLLAEGLITVSDNDGEQHAPAPNTADLDSADPYEPPKLVRYDDMVDMFALDPPLPELPSMDAKYP